MLASTPPLPRLRSPGGQILTWDDDDRLWLARAVEAEGEPRDLIAQVLVNRWAWLEDIEEDDNGYLWEFVQRYAQSVNPRWFPGGDLFEKSISSLPKGTSYAQALAKAAKRRDVHSHREQFSPVTMLAVDQALRGPITIPPGALHFAAPSVVRPDLPVLVPAADDRHNVIYGEADGRGAGARYSIVAAEPAARSPSSTAGRVAVVVGVLALGMGLGLGAARLK